MVRDDLTTAATALVAPGRRILAADECPAKIANRFAAIGVEWTEETRHDYRELSLRSTDAMRGALSGVILHDETFRQNAADGASLVSLIEQPARSQGSRSTSERIRSQGAPASL